MKPRIYLKKFTKDIKEDLIKWMTPLLLSKEETKYFMNKSLKTERHVSKWVSNRIRRWKYNGFSWYAILSLGSNEFIGGIYSDLDDSETCVQIGFILLKEFWGNGYAEEAFYIMMKELDDKGLLYYNKRTCWTTVYPENQRSIKLLEKLGFIKEENPCNMLYVKDRLLYIYNDIGKGDLFTQNKEFINKLRDKYIKS